jgi:uncharacterized protein (DUF342 family)
MSIDKLKQMLEELDRPDSEDPASSEIEVIADSIQEGLDVASREMGVEVEQLDYSILQRGTKGFLGFGKSPYRLLVTKSQLGPVYEGLDDDFDLSLSGSGEAMDDGGVAAKEAEPQDVDGSVKVRVLKSGIWIWVFPPKGQGKPAVLEDALQKLAQIGLSNTDIDEIERLVKERSGEPYKLGDWKPNPELDSTVYIELSEDEMKAWAHVTPPRGLGRHLEYEDILRSLEAKGVVYGINEQAIQEYLDKADYSSPLEAASGQKPRNGKDAQIEYKVRIKKEINLEEDEQGRVNFANQDQVENVVAGQVLAVKIPPDEGEPGRTVTNRIIDVKPGRDGQIRHGKGTILSEDGLTLTAEINGEVIYSQGRIAVYPVKTIGGDVGMSTGNIVFLGSVAVTGNVKDNFSIKAAGNIEVRGTVQKAHLEAEGDIIIRGGIQGREEGYIESTGGSVYAKFIQSAHIISEGEIVVAEGILHSKLDAGAKVICNGRRAQIVGGVIRAGKEVRAKTIGSEANTPTEVRVGFKPKLLRRVLELKENKEKIQETLTEAEQTIKYLNNLKAQGGDSFSEEKKEKLETTLKDKVKYEEKIEDIDNEMEEITQNMSVTEAVPSISVDKVIWPNVSLYIQDASLGVHQDYNHVTFIRRGDDITITNFQETDEEKKKSSRRRRKKK